MNFWIKVFSEPGPDGTPSTCRVVMALFAVAAVAWVSYMVLRTHNIPDLWHIAAFVSSPYAVNKASATISDFKK